MQLLSRQVSLPIEDGLECVGHPGDLVESLGDLLACVNNCSRAVRDSITDQRVNVLRELIELGEIAANEME